MPDNRDHRTRWGWLAALTGFVAVWRVIVWVELWDTCRSLADVPTSKGLITPLVCPDAGEVMFATVHGFLLTALLVVFVGLVAILFEAVKELNDGR